MTVLELRESGQERAAGERPEAARRPVTLLRDAVRGGRARGLAVLGPVLAVVGAVQAIGMDRAPQRIDDEGTYVAQAWAVTHLGELTHYTYWYDHPPLGWLQMAGWSALTRAFERAPYAVAAGREFMLVCALVSAALLWVVARRLDLPRWAAALAIALFGLSPLAVQFHRTVYLDNVATPWVLGAFALALSPRRRLPAFAAAGLCMAVAALTKETSLLLLPALAWLLWQRSSPDTRRYTLTVSATIFALAGSFYVLYALIKGEGVPGRGHTSLLGGLEFQLGGRQASGSVLTPGTLGYKTVHMWLQLDVVLPALAVLAAVAGALVRRLRPLVLGFAVLLAIVVRPGGYLPVPFVIALLPLGALLVAGVATAAVRYLPKGRAGLLARPFVPVAAAVAVAGLAVAAPAWTSQLRGLLIAPLDAPMSQATAWMAANVKPGDRILTDDALWVDLVEAGFGRDDVVWFYKPDTDPAVPTGWRSYGWVVSTDSVRSFPAVGATVRDAVAHSAPVAVFGTGERRVEVRRVTTAPTDTRDQQEQQARRAAGSALAVNPGLHLTGPARDALTGGRVDGRLLLVLAALAGRVDLGTLDLPGVPAETAAGLPARTAVLASVDGRTGTAARDLLRRQLAGQAPGFRADVTTGPGGAAVLRVPLLTP